MTTTKLVLLATAVALPAYQDYVKRAQAKQQHNNCQ